MKNILQHNRIQGLLIIFLVILMPISIFASQDSLPSADETYAFAEINTEDTLPKISAASCIIIDADSGNILYEKNAMDKQYPASTLKIITTMLALEENLSLDQKITMSEDSIWKIDRESTNIALDVGEQITVDDCLHAIMLPSANEASYAMAEYAGGGSYNAFIDKMNQKATALGCKNSNFTNATGLHDPNQYTCAYDMALFMKEALTLPYFRTLCSKESYTIPATNLSTESRILYNNCPLLSEESSYYYAALEGGKTGMTEDGTYNFVSFAKQDNRELICVVMGTTERESSFSDTINLYQYCYTHFTDIKPLESISISENEDSTDYINSNYWNKTTLNDLHISYDTGYTLYVPETLEAKDITHNLVLYDTPKGDEMGYLSLSYKGIQLGTVTVHSTDGAIDPIVTKEDPSDKKNEQQSFFQKYKWLIILFILIGLLLLFYIIKTITDQIITKKNRKSNKNFEQKGRHKY